MRKSKGLALLMVVLVTPMLASTRQDKTENPPANASQDQPQPIQNPDSSSQITLPSGTTISIRITDVVNTNHNHPGDLITGTVDPSVLIADHVIIPRGTEAHMRLAEDKKGGHLHGKAAVTLELVALVLNKEKLEVDTDQYDKKQGALSAKVEGASKASASSGASAATSATPEGGVVGPVIAVFRAAKVEMPAGTRIPFTLTAPFTFASPAAPVAQH
jgi:hypothetical protein